MRHARPITKLHRPDSAQIDLLLQFLSIFNTLLSFYQTIVETFFPEKGGEPEA